MGQSGSKEAHHRPGSGATSATSATSSSWSPYTSERLSQRSNVSDKPLPSLHGSLMRTQKHRNPLRFYNVIQIIGEGSIGSVSKVEKRQSARGGSARSEFVVTEMIQDKCCFGFQLPFFPCPQNVFQTADNDSVDKDVPSSGSVDKDVPSSGSFDDEIVPLKENDGPTSTEKKSRYASRKHTSSMITYGQNKDMHFALKTIHLDRVRDPTLKLEMLNEISILQDLDHPNIVKAIETFDYSNRLFLVLELCNGGDLYARDPYTEEQACEILHSVVDAVAYMHSRGITHRDLKYENIMFASPDSSNVKIIDFGLSKKYADKGHLHDTVGTVYTMAPEVILGDYNNKVDMWSVGVIAFMLLSSSLPFYGKTRAHVIKRIMACQYSYKSRRWQKVSEDAKLFVSKMLQKDGSKRPSAGEALSSKWLKRHFVTRAEEEDYVMMDRVFATISTFAKYGRLKKLALLVIAYKSTDEEIGFLRRIFKKFDKLKDGEISLPEFKEALDEYNYSDEELEIMFDGIDIDQTGKIHYSEFLAATIETHRSIDEERIAEAFDRLDSDDSGYITVGNLKSFLGDDVREEYLDAIIQEADIVKDHRISYDEFLSLWDEAEDEKLRSALESVSLRRSASADSEGESSIPSTNSDEIMTVSSKMSVDSSVMGGSFFFGKEREKSMRGVWI